MFMTSTGPINTGPSPQPLKRKWVATKAADIAVRLPKETGGKKEYAIQSGDTLYELAIAVRDNNLGGAKDLSIDKIWKKIASDNNLDPKKLKIGQKITIDLDALKECKKEAKPPVTPEAKPPVTPEAKPPVTPEAKPPATPEAKPPVTPEAKPPVTPEAKPPATPESELSNLDSAIKPKYTWRNLWGYNFGLW